MRASRAFRIQILDRCPECDGDLLLRRRKADGIGFVGCSRFPSCGFAADAGDQDLRELVHELQRRLDEARRVAPIGAHSLAKRLRELIAWSHPDRHPDDQISATEVCARLNALRDEVTE